MTMPTFTDGTVVHQGDLNTLSSGINNLSTYALGAVPPRAYVPTVRLRRTAAQTITTNVNTAVSWDTIDINNDNMFSLASPTVVTVQTAGSYAVAIEYGFASNNTGGRVLWGTKNGITTNVNSGCIDEQNATTVSTGRGNTLHVSSIFPNCVVGDTFFGVVFQSSGGNLTNVISPFWPYSSFNMWRIGP